MHRLRCARFTPASRLSRQVLQPAMPVRARKGWPHIPGHLTRNHWCHCRIARVR